VALKTLKTKLAPSRRAKLMVRKRADSFYLSKQWRDLVRRLIAKRGRMCERCGKTREDDGSPVRLIGDHRVERNDGGADMDERNVELLCSAAGGNGRPHPDGKRGACHARKTSDARADRLALL
jgi:5-methylcytosine-specific restriction protein A